MAASSWNGKIWISGMDDFEPCYISTNSGFTWQSHGGGSTASVACSADGNVMGCINNNSISTNLGANWFSPPVSPAFEGEGQTVFPADGNIWMVISDYGMSISTNEGNSWATNSVPGTNDADAAVSADGTKIAIIQRFPSFSSESTSYLPGWIYVSTNSGSSWLRTSAPSNYWTSIACSADGNTLVASAGIFTGYLDGNGPLTTSSGGIYTSSDGGNTWVSNSVPDVNWYSVSCSADGSKMVAADDDAPGAIYTSYSTPSLQLNISAATANPAFSWVLPATNFVLQESSNVMTPNWVTLTNVPSLNLANLREQLMLSATNSGEFFRLISQ